MDPTLPFRLLIPQSVLDALLAHARSELPNECVGFLAGRIESGVGQVSLQIPLVNERPRPDEFLTQPRSLFTAYRTMRETHTDVLAIYHSHPTAPAIPSQRDLQQNTYGSQVIWFIVGFPDQQLDLRAWWLEDTTFREAHWDILST